MTPTYDLLVGKLEELEQGVTYARLEHAGRHDTKEYGAAREWSALNTLLSLTSIKLKTLEYLDQIFEMPIADLSGPALDELPEQERLRVMDRRRELIDDLLMTVKTLRHLTAFEGRNAVTQKPIKRTHIREQSPNDLGSICAIERSTHQTRAWTKERFATLFMTEEYQRGETDVSVLVNQENGAFLGYYSWRRQSLDVPYARYSDLPKVTKKPALVMQGGSVGVAYRDYAMEGLTSFVLRDLKEAGFRRLEDGIDAAHPEPTK